MLMSLGGILRGTKAFFLVSLRVVLFRWSVGFPESLMLLLSLELKDLVVFGCWGVVASYGEVATACADGVAQVFMSEFSGCT